MNELASIHRLVWMALLAALTAVGAMISIPVIPPVPFTLQTLFVCLAGLILGPRGGALCMALYLGAGLLGLPVFTGGKAGLAAFLGPTGGYMMGFIPAASLCGFASGQDKSFMTALSFCILGTAVTLVLGTLYLASVQQIGFSRAMYVGLIPFVPGGVVKCLAAATIYRFLTARRLLPV